jgi:hypothetical protein
MTKTEAKWAERLEQWKASGKSQEEFAQGKPFKASTLRWWSTELKRRNVRGQEEPAGDIRMARVMRKRSGAAGASTSSGLVVEVSGVRIALNRGFDAELLAQVVQAVGGAR